LAEGEDVFQLHVQQEQVEEVFQEKKAAAGQDTAQNQALSEAFLVVFSQTLSVQY
jgi:hypothetical protein